MELSKSECRLMTEIIKKGILRRCKEWLNETKHLIEMNYDGNENEFDRCMKVTKRSRNFFKEAMRREDYYRNSMMLSGVCRMLTEGYLTLDDLKELSQELQTSIKLMAGKNDS